ncbi:DgyrCDS11976 [Dimorphilus gyrociliatus]|uniref:DgyrCDS11976 n=1 Tax=Dimorphilus gyrociliatus TaxID=2664684 RepID=A0A7I8W656_9ANNE|nr:DgyrCDS11976 [Dimorphilus gyrociliatus]
MLRGQTLQEELSNPVRLLKSLADTSPDRISLIGLHQRISYSELFTNALNLSEYLQTYNCNQKVIGIVMESSIERIVAIIAVWIKKCIVLAFDPQIQPESFIIERIKENNVDLVISNCNARNHFAPIVINYKEAMNSIPMTRTINLNDLSSGDVLCILYTSGSEGKPKKIELRSESLIVRLVWQWQTLPWQKKEIALHKTSILFVDSWTEVWGAILKGVPLVIASEQQKMDVNSLLNLIDSFKITRIVLVPSVLDLLLQSGRSLPNLQTIISSGEKLPLKLATDCLKFWNDKLLVNLYGMTEVTGDVTFEVFRSIPDLNSKIYNCAPSVGQPVFNTNIYIVKENRICNEREIGEICISGDLLVTANVTDNKYSNEGKHSRIFYTGDHGLIREGRVYVLGRKDDELKLAGARVQPSQVSEELLKMPAISEAFAMGLDNRLILYYTSDNSITNEDAENFLIERLPSYMVPSIIEKIDSLPKQPHTGKIDRQKIRDLYQSQFLIDRQNEDAFSDKILIIIAKSLKLDSSTTDIAAYTFQQLGGNSISAMHASALLAEEGMTIHASQLFNCGQLKNLTAISSIPYSIAEDYEIFPLESIPNPERGIKLVAHSFALSNPLDVLACTSEQSLVRLITAMFPAIRGDQLSSACFYKKNLVGIQFTMNVSNEEPPQQIRLWQKTPVGAINTAAEAAPLDFAKNYGGLWADSVLTAINSELLQPEQRMEVLEKLFINEINVVKSRGINGILTVNSHPVTADLAETFFDYKIVSKIHASSWKHSDGTTPFSRALNNYYVLGMVKILT